MTKLGKTLMIRKYFLTKNYCLNNSSSFVVGISLAMKVVYSP